jgi:hypothetical protein
MTLNDAILTAVRNLNLNDGIPRYAIERRLHVTRNLRWCAALDGMARMLLFVIRTISTKDIEWQKHR